MLISCIDSLIFAQWMFILPYGAVITKEKPGILNNVKVYVVQLIKKHNSSKARDGSSSKMCLLELYSVMINSI